MKLTAGILHSGIINFIFVSLQTFLPSYKDKILPGEVYRNELGSRNRGGTRMITGAELEYLLEYLPCRHYSHKI